MDDSNRHKRNIFFNQENFISVDSEKNIPGYHVTAKRKKTKGYGHLPDVTDKNKENICNSFKNTTQNGGNESCGDIRNILSSRENLISVNGQGTSHLVAAERKLIKGYGHSLGVTEANKENVCSSFKNRTVNGRNESCRDVRNILSSQENLISVNAQGTSNHVSPKRKLNRENGHLLCVTEANKDNISNSLNKNTSVGINVDKCSGWQAVMNHNIRLKILRSSWTQSDPRVFFRNAGKQCTAMIAAAIIMATILFPGDWNRQIIDRVLYEGDRFYNQCINHPQNVGKIYASGYLQVNNLLPNVQMFHKPVSLQFQPDPEFFGSVLEDMVLGQPNLSRSLNEFFLSNTSGVVIHNAYSYGIFKLKSSYFLFDSHSLGPKGSKAADGKAAIMEFSNLQDLHRILVNNLHGEKKNSQFTIDSLHCTILEEENIVEAISSLSPQLINLEASQRSTIFNSQNTQETAVPQENEALLNKLLKVREGHKRQGFHKSEQRENQLLKNREYQATKRFKENEEQRQNRLLKDREYQATKIFKENEEQRQNRLLKKKECQKTKLQVETYEEREARLNRLKKNWQKRKSETQSATESTETETEPVAESQISFLDSNDVLLDMHMQNFQDEISCFADKICEICRMRCYPKQISTFDLDHMPLEVLRQVSLLPAELRTKSSLKLCNRCRSYYSRKGKKMFPPKAYWNNLDPGPIPPEIEQLTFVEKMLLARVKTHQKIIKYTGKFGQYGLKGQAIHFAQDIFEVAEKLPEFLPRPLDSVGCIIIVESLENINVVRDLYISKTRIENALNFLVLNNPLYKDVKMVFPSNGFQIQTIAREVNPDNVVNADPQLASDWKSVVNHGCEIEILRSSWSEFDVIFNDNAGKQSTAMAAAAIFMSYVKSPNKWEKGTIDNILLEGDSFYRQCYDVINLNKVNSTGTLTVTDLLKNPRLFGISVFLEFEPEPEISGNIYREEDGSPNLQNGLEIFFDRYKSGILIYNGYSYGLIKADEFFYLFDPHSLGPKGSKGRNASGKASTIRFKTVRDLYKLCVSNLHGDKQLFNYTLHHLQCICIDGNDQVSQHGDDDCHLHHYTPCGDRMPAGDADADNDPDLNLNLQDIPMQSSVLMLIDDVQPSESAVVDIPQNSLRDQPVPLYNITRKTTDNIVNMNRELKLEELAWYYLFPYGKNGLQQERLVPITPLDYFQSRVMGEDTRFQTVEYIFYALSLFEYYKTQSVISVCGQKIKVQDKEDMIDDLHLYTRSFRGSASYWKTTLNELLATIKCLGAPQFFLTFSCNDLNWPDMIKELLIADGTYDQNKNIKDIPIMTRQRLVEKYPVLLCRHFMIRVYALLKFLRIDVSIFGKPVTDIWLRVEFQNRGSPHLHVIIWVDGLPDFDSEEGIELIDKIISCEMPPEEDQELRELVTACQLHRHTHTCTKNTDHCRFGFPRQRSDRTRIIDSRSNEFLSNSGRICILKRKQGEEYVNNYNKTLLKLWQGNIDIQPCGNTAAIAYYIAKYISKNEPTTLDKSLRDAIAEIRKEDSLVSKKIFKICMAILNRRQVSACEACFRLCHLLLKKSSRKCIFVNTRKPHLRYRVVNFKSNGGNKFCDNIFDRYQKRPDTDEFSDMCLGEFAGSYEPYYNKKNFAEEEDGDADAYDDVDNKPSRLITLLDNTKMKKRNRRAVIRTPYFPLRTDREAFCYSLLVLHVPFRNEQDLLRESETSEQALMRYEDYLKSRKINIEGMENFEKDLETALDNVRAFMVLEQYQTPREEQDDVDEDSVETPIPLMADDNFEQAKTCMNIKQRRLFNYITTHIQNQLHDSSVTPIRLFITGGAGTGKTFVLKLIVQQIARCYGVDVGEVVKVGALTGVAAKLVNGLTLHSLFKLPVQKDGTVQALPLLTGRYLKHMRHQWSRVHFLIIDEISMVPYQMLVMINSRLQQLKESDDFFGGINLLAFGDLLQLPPIKLNPVFEQPEYLKPSIHLWRELFNFCELEENMRQKGDMTFINLLNNLRTGDLSTDQLKILLQKFAESTQTGDFAHGKAIRIFPTRAMVDEYNQHILDSISDPSIEKFTIKAQDVLLDKDKFKSVDFDKITPQDINKTGGYPKELIIFKGAKVMLRRNYDLRKGLVNGSIGVIEEIVWPNYQRGQLYERNLPKHVVVDFEGIGRHNIEPWTVSFPAKMNYGTMERTMLPLIHCWASTVHKLQGATVQKAVVYLGSKLFAPGQAYVAASRVTSLDGLQICEIDSEKLLGKSVCNEKAMNELVRLRSMPNILS